MLEKAWQANRTKKEASINFLIFKLDLALNTLGFRILRTTKKTRTTNKKECAYTY